MTRIVRIEALDDEAGTRVVWTVDDGSGVTTLAELCALWRWLTGEGGGMMTCHLCHRPGKTYPCYGRPACYWCLWATHDDNVRRAWWHRRVAYPPSQHRGTVIYLDGRGPTVRLSAVGGPDWHWQLGDRCARCHSSWPCAVAQAKAAA